MLEARKLGTNPRFKKARSIGEKVARAWDKKENSTGKVQVKKSKTLKNLKTQVTT